MSRYVLSPRAQFDIDEIWDYTADQWGVDQANRYTRDIQAAIEAVAQDPRSGRSCDEIHAGYFRVSVGSHVVFYRVEVAHIRVARILHQRRDFRRHL
jgi:toxin ParE1/3/4